MAQSGFDAAFDTTPHIPQLLAGGAQWAGRYYSHNSRKNIHRPEAEALSAARIPIVAVWEANGDQISTFTETTGAADATAALACAVAAGQPAGSAIYFAVDCDANGGDIIQHVVPYFKSVGPVLAGHYRPGVYGSGFVLSTLRANNLASLFWLGGAMGWRGSRDFKGEHIRQGLPADLYGIGTKVDPDKAVDGDFGQWLIGADALASIPPVVPAPAAPVRPWLDTAAVQRRLRIWGYALIVDGIFGTRTQDSVERFQAAAGLDVDGTVGPKTWAELMKDPESC